MPKLIDLAAVAGFNAAAETFYSAGILLHARIEPYSLTQSPYRKRMMATMESRLTADDHYYEQSSSSSSSEASARAAGCAIRGLTGSGDACGRLCATAKDLASAGKRRTPTGAANKLGRQSRGACRVPARVSVEAVPLPVSLNAGLEGSSDCRLAPPFSAPQLAGGPNGADGSSCWSTSPILNLNALAVALLRVHEPLRVSDYTSLKTHFHLVSTMNAAYPDFDFSDTPAECFHKVTRSGIMHLINEHVYVCTTDAHDLICNQLWDALNLSLNGLLDEAAIYVYVPCRDNEDPLHHETTLWSANVLFYHRVQRRILVLKLREESCLSISSDEMGSISYSDSLAWDEQDKDSSYSMDNESGSSNWSSSASFFMKA